MTRSILHKRQICSARFRNVCGSGEKTCRHALVPILQSLDANMLVVCFSYLERIAEFLSKKKKKQREFPLSFAAKKIYKFKNYPEDLMNSILNILNLQNDFLLLNQGFAK